MAKDSHYIKTTGDGSHTVFSRGFDQHFHNPNGAIAESRHVFFEESGLLTAIQSKSHLNIAETGFGTGLNLLLLCEYMNKLNCRVTIRYFAAEGYPLQPEVVEQLNYHHYLDLSEQLPHPSGWFKNLKSGWNLKTITPRIKLLLFVGEFDEWQMEPESIDYFFHDPFSIDVNPEGWTKSLFSRLRSFARHDALLATYAAATRARAAMAAAGWQLAGAPGAMGKREMTVASPDEKQLKGFKMLNTQRLKERYYQEFADKE